MPTNLHIRSRSLLMIYMVAVFGLLALPFSEPEFSLFGIESDKWFHVAIFVGLSVLLRLSLQEQTWAWALAFLLSCGVAMAVELVQAVLPYRDAELSDLLAGVLGSLLGSAIAVWIVASNRPHRALGAVAILLGILIGLVSVFADLLGIGADRSFGVHQVLGAFLGVLVTVAGGGIYFKRLSVGGFDSNSE